MKIFLLISSTLIYILSIFSGTALAIDVEKVTTLGGIEAWLIRDHNNPIISLRFSFRGGGALDPEKRLGLANMAASTMDEGAGKLDSQTFQKTLQNKAIRIQFSASMDNFGGRLQTLVRHQDLAFKLLRLALTQPRFDREPIERIRSQILVQLKREEENPHSIASRALRRALYGNHPYGRSIKGTPVSLKSITGADLRDFVKRRIAKNNLVIGVVGDITRTKLETILEDTFGNLPKKAVDWQLPNRQVNADGRTIVIKKKVPQSAILFAGRGLLRDDPDFYAAFVMNHILGGGGFTSRLYKEIREKRGLAYSISSGLNPRQASATIVGGAGTANARVRETLDIIKAEWQRMSDHGVTDKELKDAKTFLTGAYPLRFTESERIARMLVGLQLANLGDDYIKNRNTLIKEVSRDDVGRIAKKLLDAERLVTVVVGQPSGITSTP